MPGVTDPDGWVDYFLGKQIVRLSSKRAAVLEIADAMATRVHKDFVDAGAWPSSEKHCPLHAFDIELGRIMLGVSREPSRRSRRLHLSSTPACVAR